MGQLPQFMHQSLLKGEVTGYVEFYNEKGERKNHEDLAIDPYTYEVKPMKIQLGGEAGQRYFIVFTFFYEEVGIGKYPFAVVFLEKLIPKEGLDFSFVSEDFRIHQEELRAELLGGPPESVMASLPNLDPDEDQYMSYYEVAEGSDPGDAKSLPFAPEIEGSIEPGQEDLIKFELIIRDRSGIRSVRRTSPLCGYATWKIENLDEYGKAKKLTGLFNTHAVKQSSMIQLSIEAEDILGISKTYHYEVSFTKSANPDRTGPEIAVIFPGEGESISDIIYAEAIACDEGEVTSLVPLVEDSGDEDELPNRYFGQIDTEKLGDGGQYLSFEAENDQGDIRQYDLPIVVVNESPIKLTSPLPGSTITGPFILSAYVDKTMMPDVKAIWVESVYSGGQEDFDFTPLKVKVNQSDDVYMSQMEDISFESHEREFTVVLKAQGETQIFTRTVTYYLDNDPNIERFELENQDQFGSCMTGGQVRLHYQVTNRQSEDEISLWDTENDVQYADLTNETGEGFYELDCDLVVGQKLVLKAKRAVGGGEFESQASIPIQHIGIWLLNDPKIVMPGNQYTYLLNLPLGFRWKVERYRNGQLEWVEIGQAEEDTEKVSFGDLAPRGLYKMVIHAINDEEETVSKTEHGLHYLTRDHGLVGWWNFREYSYEGSLYEEKYFSWLDQQIDDYGPQGDALHIRGTAPDTLPIWETYPGSEEVEGLRFHGEGSYVQEFTVDHYDVSLLHGKPDGLTLEVLLKVTEPQPDVEHIVAQNGEFSLGIKNGEYFAKLGIDKECNGGGFQEIGWPEFPTNTPFTNDAWDHVVITFSKEGNNPQYVKIFVNGKKKIEKPVVGDFNTACTNQFCINCLHDVIGNLPWYQYEGFKGIIGEVSLYDRALPINEIKLSCNRLVPGLCP